MMCRRTCVQNTDTCTFLTCTYSITYWQKSHNGHEAYYLPPTGPFFMAPEVIDNTGDCLRQYWLKHHYFWYRIQAPYLLRQRNTGIYFDTHFCGRVHCYKSSISWILRALFVQSFQSMKHVWVYGFSTWSVCRICSTNTNEWLFRFIGHNSLRESDRKRVGKG